MGKFQLSQMSVAKLTSRFRLQAHLGTKQRRFSKRPTIGKRATYITIPSGKEYLLRKFHSKIFLLLIAKKHYDNTPNRSRFRFLHTR